MAFDRTGPPTEAVTGQAPEANYSLEFGRTYVAPEEVQQFFMLSDHEQRALAAWAERLIPAEGSWPSAAQVNAHMYVDNCCARSPLLRSLLMRAIQTVDRHARQSHGSDFAECDAQQRDEILQALESGSDSALFNMVLELVFEGYYSAGPVLELTEERTDFRILAPVEGSGLDPFDESLLARVRTLPSIVREA